MSRKRVRARRRRELRASARAKATGMGAQNGNENPRDLIAVLEESLADTPREGERIELGTIEVPVYAVVGEPVMIAGASGGSFPLSDRERAWDAAAASKRWQGACGIDGDSPDWAKFHSGFFWYDSADGEKVGAHKLQFVDVVSGTATAVWRGVTAAAGAVQGARGGVSIPSGDVSGVQSKIAGYYAKARKAYDDADIQVPWKEAAETSGQALALAYAEAGADGDFGDRWGFWIDAFEQLADLPPAVDLTAIASPERDIHDPSMAADVHPLLEQLAESLDDIAGPARADVVLAALTAAGVKAAPVATVYDMVFGSLAGRKFVSASIEAGHSAEMGAAWPCEAELELDRHGQTLFAGDNEAVFRLKDGTLAHVKIAHGWFHATFTSSDRVKTAAAACAFSAAYPPLYRAESAGNVVPITFWTYGKWGPQSRLRMIEAGTWAEVERNYTGAVRDGLASLMGDEFEAGKDGQLLLWHGEPGTGKTWALRALASEWVGWAEFHYITDPDIFFGEHPDYMVDVLLSDTYQEITPAGDIVDEVNAGGKWRVLILEDTGELLSATAKASYRQGLSRLLNVVDGMIGQGLKVLALVTTNDTLEEIHEAVTRPGRLASQIHFGAMTAEEASEWLGYEVEEGGTLAELYAIEGEPVVASALADFDVLPPEHQPQDVRPPMQPGPAQPVTEMPTNASQARWNSTLLPEGRLTSDGRCIAPGATQWRELPLSLMAMLATGPGGHEGAQLCGRIDSIYRAAPLVRGDGVFDDGEYGAEIARLVGDGTLRGLSVDLAIHAYEIVSRAQFFNPDGTLRDDWEQMLNDLADDETSWLDQILGGEEDDLVFLVTDCEIGMATVCPFPAFAEADITIAASGTRAFVTVQGAFEVVRTPERPPLVLVADPGPASPTPPTPVESGPVVTASAAGLAPVTPPASWFDAPAFAELTPLTITDAGQVYGHAAPWETCHIGIPGGCTVAPHSRTGYAYFHLGEVEASADELVEGEVISTYRTKLPCGQITLDTNHAGRLLNAQEAATHYDHTGTAVADVVCGEDEHGIWVAGALRPSVDAEKARVFRGAKLSGDWRSVKGNLELVALLACNVPGFPVPRTRAVVASVGDHVEVQSLVAAGINPLNAQEISDTADDVLQRLAGIAAGDVPPDEAETLLVALAERQPGGYAALAHLSATEELERPSRGDPVVVAAIEALSMAHTNALIARVTALAQERSSMDDAHARTVSQLVELVASGSGGHTAAQRTELIGQAMGAVTALATREHPAPAAPHLEVHVEPAAPAQVHVDAPPPAQVEVNIEPPPPAEVNVEVHPPPAAPAPNVEVVVRPPRAAPAVPMRTVPVRDENNRVLYTRQEPIMEGEE